MRISDWSSDVCSSDLAQRGPPLIGAAPENAHHQHREERRGGKRERRRHHEQNVGGLAGRHPGRGKRHGQQQYRSQERRVGKECGRTGRYRWSAYHEKKTVREVVPSYTVIIYII